MVSKIRTSRFILLILLIIFSNCAQNDRIEEIENQQGLLEYDIKEISKNSDYYESASKLFSSFQSNRINAYGESLRIGDKVIRVSYQENDHEFTAIQLIDHSLANFGFTVKSSLIDISFNNPTFSITKKISYIQRELIKGNVVIKEMVSIATGRIITYSLNNISEDAYLKLRDQNYNTKINGSADPSTTIYCFTTWRACMQHLDPSQIPGETLAPPLCDFFPCGSFATVGCTIAKYEGWIESEGCGFSCEACDVLLGER